MFDNPFQSANSGIPFRDPDALSSSSSYEDDEIAPCQQSPPLATETQIATQEEIQSTGVSSELPESAALNPFLTPKASVEDIGPIAAQFQHQWPRRQSRTHAKRLEGRRANGQVPARRASIQPLSGWSTPDTATVTPRRPSLSVVQPIDHDIAGQAANSGRSAGKIRFNTEDAVSAPGIAAARRPSLIPSAYAGRQVLDNPRRRDSTFSGVPGRRSSETPARRSSNFTGAQRKGSFQALFGNAFQPRRKDSSIDPFTAEPRRSISEGAGIDADAPPRRQSTWGRAMSFAAEPRFTHPFKTDEGTPITFRQARRLSEGMQRRASAFQRSMSVVYQPNPFPQRYRSRSVTSVAYFISPMSRNNSVCPIFEEDILAEKANVQEFLEAAEKIQNRQTRSKLQMEIFRVAYLIFTILTIYFIFVGRPLWDGISSLYYNFIKDQKDGRNLGSAVLMIWATAQSAIPILFGRFEREVDDVEKRDASETALVIPAYKAANVLPETIEAALKVFKKEQIYIIANGNNPTPLDNTADVCKRYGVHHAWVPIGSKITAEFVGIALTRKYKYIMLIDDDVHIPSNLPLVTDRIAGNVKCIGYTIKSTGPNGAKGTLINQCQDMEYKMAGLSRVWSGKWGSATFPHGAIILWEREALQNLFNVHPGYVISEDWYFGHCARASGYRIDFCSQVFVETETPPFLFKASGSARGGFGEMTVYKQRHYRWNYFFLYRLWDDGVYLLLSWRLGWREIVTKFFVFIEIYDSIMAIIRPWIMVVTLIGAPQLLFLYAAVLTVMYTACFALFNVWHLRQKNEMVSWKSLPVYMAMKFALLWVSSFSVYRALYHYAWYFMKRHPRLIESKAALEAAYNVRLGTALVPLDTSSTNEKVAESQRLSNPFADRFTTTSTPAGNPNPFEDTTAISTVQVNPLASNQSEKTRLVPSASTLWSTQGNVHDSSTPSKPSSELSSAQSLFASLPPGASIHAPFSNSGVTGSYSSLVDPFTSPDDESPTSSRKDSSSSPSMDRHPSSTSSKDSQIPERSSSSLSLQSVDSSIELTEKRYIRSESLRMVDVRSGPHGFVG